MSVPLQSAPNHYLYNCLHTCPYHFSLLLITTSTIASTHVRTTSVCSYSPPLQLPPHMSVPLQSAPNHYLYNCLHTCPYHFSLLLITTSTIASTHVRTTSVCSYSPPLQLPPHMSVPLQSAPNHYLYNCLHTCPYHFSLLIRITSTIASTHVHTTSVCSYALPLQLPPHMSIPLQSAPTHYLYNCLHTCPYHFSLLLITTSTIASTHVHTTSVCS